MKCVVIPSRLPRNSWRRGLVANPPPFFEKNFWLRYTYLSRQQVAGREEHCRVDPATLLTDRLSQHLRRARPEARQAADLAAAADAERVHRELFLRRRRRRVPPPVLEVEHDAVHDAVETRRVLDRVAEELVADARGVPFAVPEAGGYGFHPCDRGALV